MSAHASLQQAWQADIARGALLTDAAQIAAIARLDALEICLRQLRPEPLLQRLRTWLGRSAGAPPCRGIYLWGGVGRGKTRMMDRFHARLSLPSRRLHFHHFMREVHARLRDQHRREQPLAAVAAQFAREARVLCLDELQVQDVGDAMLLHGMFAGLLARGVVLVITSNQHPSQLYAGGLQRERFLPAIALLEARLEVVEIAPGSDYRLRQLAGASTWFDANSPDTPRRMNELFVNLAGDTGPSGATVLEVEGRPLPARRAAGDLAWFDFAVLCEGPRSADDYIALAEELHTLFLSDVPVFDARHDDAARRFIALIDELYDRRVKLVTSAAAEPDALYRGERLRAPFVRTSSRLLEMRSAAYLSRAHQAIGARVER